MSPTKKPSAVTGLRRGVAVPQVRSDESIGRPEDIGRLAPNPYLEADLRNAPPPRPPKPVRVTLDLDEDRHAFLKRFAADSGPGVGSARVLRALLDELAEDPDLAARVRTRIWAEKR